MLQTLQQTLWRTSWLWIVVQETTKLQETLFEDERKGKKSMLDKTSATSWKEKGLLAVADSKAYFQEEVLETTW
jgi:hypothetical protein